MSANTVIPEIGSNQEALRLPKTSAKHVARDKNGKLLPGHTANPNGRPRTVRIREAFEHILATEGADKYARVVTNIALKGKRQADKLAAVRDIRDTVEGKPIQAMLVGHVVDESSIRVIAEMLGKLHIPPALEQNNE